MKKLLAVAIVLSFVVGMAVVMVPEAQAGDEGAIVINTGNGKGNGICRLGGRTTTDVSANLTPSGRGRLTCHFDDFGERAKTLVRNNLGCRLNLGGESFITRDAKLTWNKNGRALFSCHFDGS